MRKRNHSIVAVIFSQSHRVTDIVAISKQLRSGKAYRARLCGRSRSQFEQIAPQTGGRRRTLHGDTLESRLLEHETHTHAAKLLNPLATAIRHFAFHRQNRSAAAPHCEEDRGPFGTIADLQADHLTGGQFGEPVCPTPGLLLNRGKCPPDPPFGREYSWLLLFGGHDLLPPC